MSVTAKFDHTAQDGRPVYTVGQPTNEMCAKVLLKVIRSKTRTEAEEAETKRIQEVLREVRNDRLMREVKI